MAGAEAVIGEREPRRMDAAQTCRSWAAGTGTRSLESTGLGLDRPYVRDAAMLAEAHEYLAVLTAE